MMWLLSLVTGFSLRTWIIAAATVAFALWTAHWYGAGYSAADAMWKAKQLEATIAKLELDAKVQKDADAVDEKADADMEAENAKLKEKVDAYEERLKTRPDAERCVLTDDDIDGMP